MLYQIHLSHRGSPSLTKTDFRFRYRSQHPGGGANDERPLTIRKAFSIFYLSNIHFVQIQILNITQTDIIISIRLFVRNAHLMNNMISSHL